MPCKAKEDFSLPWQWESWGFAQLQRETLGWEPGGRAADPSIHSPGHFETGLGPGALCCHASMLASEHTTPWAPAYKDAVWNCNCVHAQLGQILDPKDTKRPNTQLLLLRSLGSKTGCWEQKQDTDTAPAHTPSKGWAKTSQPSGPTPGPSYLHSTFTCRKEAPREPGVCSGSTLLVGAGAPTSPAWVSCLASGQFLLTGGGQEL